MGEYGFGFDELQRAVSALPTPIVRELARGPLDDDAPTSTGTGCRVCEALDGIATPIKDWHVGPVDRPTSPSLMQARCYAVYALAEAEMTRRETMTDELNAYIGMIGHGDAFHRFVIERRNQIDYWLNAGNDAS